MKKFWKRANRGLILGGVLILGVAVYEIIDYSRFANGKDEMSSVITGYITDLANASITPDDMAEYGHEKTDTEKAEAYQRLSNVVKTYWTDTHDADDYYHYKKDILLSVYAVAYDTTNPGYITDYSVNTSNLSFSKNGPNAALFSISVQFVVDSYGTCEFAIPADYYTTYYEVTDDSEADADEEDYDYEIVEESSDSTEDSETDEENEYYEGKLRTTGAITYTGELLYEDGGWKISHITYDNFSLTTTAVEEGEN